MIRKRRKKYDYDLIVIGSGAGGSVGAHYARSLGKSVLIFEKGAVGGECPNYACIPTKALLHAAEVYESVKNASQYGIYPGDIRVRFHQVREWKNLVVSRTGASEGTRSFEEEGIHVVRAKAKFISPHEVEAAGKTYSASKFIVATGSEVFIPPTPGLAEAGFLTFKDIVNFDQVPDSLFIIGGGAVGCEFGQIFSTFGTKVTIANRSRLLGNEDEDVAELVHALFEYKGITVLNNTNIIKIEKEGKKKIIYYTTDGQPHQITVDEILLATGKVPNLSFNPEKAGLLDKKGKMPINKYLQTLQPHIYAAGDLAGPYLFTHTGYYQSYIAAHNAFSYKKLVPSYDAVPRSVFITPEVASVGINEMTAKEKGIKIKKGLAPMAILGRSNTQNEFDGFVKIITDEKKRVIGGAIVAGRAGEMIHEIALAIKLKAQASDLAEMIHAYPTYSEAIKVAASNVQ